MLLQFYRTRCTGRPRPLIPGRSAGEHPSGGDCRPSRTAAHQQRTREQQSAVTPGGMEVNPEILAALPPNIQEEVSIIRIVNIDKMALKKIL